MSLGVFSQEKFETNRKGSDYKFKVLKNLEATDVQDQGRTSTCWSFSSLSFFESEIIRLKNERHNLSEMFIARNAYLGKAENYLRMYGTFTLVQEEHFTIFHGLLKDMVLFLKKYIKD